MPQNNVFSTSLLKEGDYAPDFSLCATGGQTFTLSDNKRTNIILYFYPTDGTPGCTKEAEAFARFHNEFDLYDAIIVGVSRDSVESHDKFKAKYGLPFILASDPEHSVCEAYDSWVEKNIYGKKGMGIQRNTFLIDRNGIIRKIWRKVKIDGHAEDVLGEVKGL